MQMNDIMIITKYFKCAYFFLFRQTQESMPGGQMKNFFWLFKVRFHYIILHVNLSSYTLSLLQKDQLCNLTVFAFDVNVNLHFIYRCA